MATAKSSLCVIKWPIWTEFGGLFAKLELVTIGVWSSLKFFLKFYQGQRLWGTLNTPILSPGNKNQDAMSQASLPFSKSVMYSPTFACVPGSPTGRNIFILFSVYRDLIS